MVAFAILCGAKVKSFNEDTLVSDSNLDFQGCSTEGGR